MNRYSQRYNMNSRVRNRLRRALQEELVRRLLIKYFKDKGIMESAIYPPAIFDLPYKVPELLNSVEIVPYIEKMDTITNVVTVGWNLFVLGTNRIHLGSSTHANLVEFKRSLMGNVSNDLPGERKKTANQIVEFIMDIVGKNKDVLLEVPQGVRLPLQSGPLTNLQPRFGATMSGGFYEKNKPVY